MKEYRRKFDCALCGQAVIARKIYNGWIKKCECGEIFTDDDLSQNEYFESVE